MKLSDLLRFLVVLAASLEIGFAAAVFFRVGRFFIPHAEMRLLAAGEMIVGFGICVAALENFGGGGYGWRVPFFAVGLATKTAALAALFRWYGTDAGMQHMQTLLRKEPQ